MDGRTGTVLAGGNSEYEMERSIKVYKETHRETGRDRFRERERGKVKRERGRGRTVRLNMYIGLGSGDHQSNHPNQLTVILLSPNISQTAAQNSSNAELLSCCARATTLWFRFPVEFQPGTRGICCMQKQQPLAATVRFKHFGLNSIALLGSGVARWSSD